MLVFFEVFPLREICLDVGFWSPPVLPCLWYLYFKIGS